MPGFSIGPTPGASQIVGSDSLPSTPTFSQIYITPSGLYVCLSSGNWTLLDAGPDTGVVSGAGTTNRLTKWINGSGSVVGDSALLDNGVNVTSIRPIIATNLTSSALTAGRITFAGAAGILSDDSDLTFSGDTLTITKVIAGTNITIGAGSAITSSGAGGAIGAIAYVVPGTGVATALGVNIGSAGAPVLFNGAGGTPSSITLTSGTGLPVSTGLTGAGTGVLTALGVNVGTAGAFVVNGGALGSPSSVGTLPAHTLGGTIAGGGNQLNNIIVGTSTPLAGFFTTLSGSTSTTTPILKPSADSTTALKITKTDGSTVIATVDSTNSFIGIGITPVVPFHVNQSMAADWVTKLGNTSSTGEGLVIDAGDAADATKRIFALRDKDQTQRFSFRANGNMFVTTGLTSASGTPGSLCYNTSTFEVTKNNALTCTVSSRLFKKGISSLVAALPILNKLRAVQFAYKDYPDRQRLGFIAEELAKVDRRLADNYDEKGRALSIDQNALLGLAIEAIQELGMQNQALNARLETLYAR